MQPKFLLGAVLAVFLGVFGVAILMHLRPEPASVVVSSGDEQPAASSTSAQSSGNSGGASTEPEDAAQGYTLAQVGAHADASSCWVAIAGNVYDVTGWINRHPGGPDRILGICGTDATAAFTAQHAGDRRPPQELAAFYLAPLVP